MKRQLLMLAATMLVLGVTAQHSPNSDNQYRKPLDTALAQVMKKFRVKIVYAPELTRGLEVPYADWRMRDDAEKSIINLLAPVNLGYRKIDSNTYQVRAYEYYRRSVPESREQLAALSGLYHDTAGWTKRKNELIPCMREALQLTVLPPRPLSAPIITGRRVMDGYTIENIAIETLPGLYVCGSLYRPLRVKGKVPVVLCPNGHFDSGRYRVDQQYLNVMLAKMGAISLSYDLVGYGESQLQFAFADHRRSLVMSVQTLNNIRLLDFLCSLKEADTSRVAMTGASGGGSQTMLLAALDQRIKVVAPVVMVSAFYTGGCPCETGLPVHLCGGGTNNVEMAAMAAPRPQLIVSDGFDWTANVPEIEFPYIKNIYAFYGRPERVTNIHLPQDRHDYGPHKRFPVYEFLARELGLVLVKDKSGSIDESGVVIEAPNRLFVFGDTGEKLPANAIHGFTTLEHVFNSATSNVTDR